MIERSDILAGFGNLLAEVSISFQSQPTCSPVVKYCMEDPIDSLKSARSNVDAGVYHLLARVGGRLQF